MDKAKTKVFKVTVDLKASDVDNVTEMFIKNWIAHKGIEAKVEEIVDIAPAVVTQAHQKSHYGLSDRRRPKLGFGNDKPSFYTLPLRSSGRRGY